MMKKGLFLAILVLGFSGVASSQSRAKNWQLGGGVGFSANEPGGFDLDYAAEYFWSDAIAIGFDFDILIGSTVYAFVPFFHYHFELLNAPRIEPYIGAGTGFTINNNGAAAFDLMAPNLGFQYELTPYLFLGPDMSFHFLAGNKTSWDLQMVGTIAYRF